MEDTIILRTFKYRIYPTHAQEECLDNILWVARWLYNQALAYRRKRWRESRYNVSFYDQCSMWRTWRNEKPEENPLQLLNSHAGNFVLKRLDAAYSEFKKGKRGYPRFKSWRRFNSVMFEYDNGSKIKGARLYIQNVGEIKVKWHRPLADGTLKAVSILRKPSGWYACFSLESPFEAPPAHTGPPVGIDVGILHALALSDGVVIDSPYHLKESLAKLRRLQRSVARKKPGSNRRKRAVKLLAKQHEHIANQRRDFWHKVTRWLADTYGTIALEDLNLLFMTRNKHLARAAHDTALGIFRTLLDYKAIEAGVGIVTVNPRNTSQVCSECGCIVEKELWVRLHECPYCGLTVDRDVNAARNILSLAVTPPGTGGQALT